MTARNSTRIEDLVTAAIVNHRTPDLTMMAVWSLRSLYPALPIIVVESGSPDSSAERLRALTREVQPFRLIECNENIHHGPGLDLAIREIETEWVLIFDSDCIAYRTGFIEAMLERVRNERDYMVGHLLEVDAMGYRTETGSSPAYLYVHPKCALVRRPIYASLPPFQKHGVPCLANEKAAACEGYGLIGFPVDEFVFHLGRGTASRHGYNLGAKGRLHALTHRLRLLFD